MKMSSPSYKLLAELDRLRATFPVRLWAIMMIAACLLTGFLGTTAEPESAFVLDEPTPAAEATPLPAG
ncbi:MAG TPA: hypothetical protein VMG60_11280 [Burkholderiaceae bacterium]|nr:hypothetical protein [Burkholderiaceae bacterium]